MGIWSIIIGSSTLAVDATILDGTSSCVSTVQDTTKFLSYHFLIANIVIGVACVIYAMVMFSVLIFRPYATLKRSVFLWATTSATFLVGGCTRILMVFVGEHPIALNYLYLGNALLAVFACLAAVIAWCQIDWLFTTRHPVDHKNETVSRIRDHLDTLEMGDCTVRCKKHVNRILDEVESDD